jgi:hypothetical protein
MVQRTSGAPSNGSQGRREDIAADVLSVEGDTGSSSDAVEPSPSAPSTPILCNPPDIFETVTDIFRSIRSARQRPLFVLISDMIDDKVCADVYRWRRELQAAGTTNNLDILIHSPGGVLTSCYQTARIFSRYTDSWEALVPSTAMSGATLICLGSSRIVLTDISQLGPLDPQVISKSPLG